MILPLREWIEGAKFAYSFFSVLPLQADFERVPLQKIYANALFFFPLVGLTIAGAGILLYQVCSFMSWIGAFISALVMFVLSGFLHLEAVGDVADAWYAAHSGKDPYSVIKEPTIGAMGVLWSVSLLLLKSALLAFALYNGYTKLILSVMVASRLGIVAIIKLFQFRSHFVQTLQRSLTLQMVLFTVFFYALIGWIWCPTICLANLITAVFIAVFVSRWMQKSLGFLNGDTLGCTLEITEVVLLFVGVLMWH